MFTADAATTGETYVYNVKTGDYHLDVNTGPAPRCRWHVTLERISTLVPFAEGRAGAPMWIA